MLLKKSISYVTDIKNLSTIQECYLILTKLMALENFDENQSYLLIELVISKTRQYVY